MTELRYQCGFGNDCSSEARPGALPIGQNSPQRAPFGLYAEQFTSSAFTEPRHHNRRSWFYRIRPSVVGGAFAPHAHNRWLSAPLSEQFLTPEPLRWDPLPDAKSGDFIDGLVTFAANGSALERRGSSVHLYAFQSGMKKRFAYNTDGELLLVPQHGELLVKTEQGSLAVPPGFIAVLPRGLKWQITAAQGEGSSCRGYVLENYGAPLVLPDLGPIGANGLAAARDFDIPEAAFEDIEGEFELICKFGGRLFRARLGHSPFDVVAWHGTSAPYRYDLSRFNTLGTVSFDHPDPSIFTVLTSPTPVPGLANVDFVIFPPRWMVAEHTFRPPYFHRNIMSEFMGLIVGNYDAKTGGGFVPGGGSLHNCMSPHGPDTAATKAAIDATLKPHYLGNTLAFMFESSQIYVPSAFAMTGGLLQPRYRDCWQDLPKTYQAFPLNRHVD